MIAVLFEAQIAPAQQQRYLQLAAELKPLLAEIPGFISIERFESLSSPGRLLSLSWWDSEQAVISWKQNLMHQAAQREGKASIFSDYRIRVCGVIRDYSSKTQGTQHV